MKYNDITGEIGEVFFPVAALLVYQNGKDRHNIYVESYDMNDSGQPVNAHPLTLRESNALAKALRGTETKKTAFLKPVGLLPENLLYVDSVKGCAIWTTPGQEVGLLFTDGLHIPCGKAFVPPLLWRATKQELYLFALNKQARVTEQTDLYNAPFFNMYESGKVCMGMVALKFSADCSLDTFMHQWESYFFNSQFSHLIVRNSPIKGNIVQLWQSLINTGLKFPLKTLIKSPFTIQQLLP